MFTSREVLLHSIDFEDRTFCLRVGRNDDSLKESIIRFGLLNPPIVRETASGTRMHIVCGFARLDVLRNLGWSGTNAFVMPEAQASRECLAIAIHENAHGRGFNPAEKALALAKLGAFFEKPEIISTFMPLLGLKPDLFTLEKTLELADLDFDILVSLAKGDLSEEGASLLSGANRRDTRPLFEIVRKLRVGKNKQVELIDSLIAISIREETPVNKFLESSGIDALIDSERFDPVLRADAVRRIVRNARYPRLSEWESEVDELEKRRSSLHFRLEPPRNLEGAEIRAEFFFSNGDEFKNRLKDLDDFGRSEELRRVLKLLQANRSWEDVKKTR
jgi:ParB-like chromosome segregation protein Spo0J